MHKTSTKATTAAPKALAPPPASMRFAADNFIDEYSSAWLYRELALRCRTEAQRAKLEEFARYEDRHAEAWGKILDARGIARPPPRTLSTHRWWLRMAEMFGVGTMMPVIHRHEVEAVGKYMEQEKTVTDPDIQAALGEIIPDEVTHEVEILEAFGAEDQNPGALRSVVLGANDGLGSILALVAGVAGAVASSAVVLLAGIAGLVAGAVSMALSNYISVKSEREGRDARVEIQRVGVARAPETKRAQLAHLLEGRGLSPEESKLVVERLSKDPERLLQAIVQEGYGLGEAAFEKPGRLAAYTGISFLIAGAIPVLPFFFMPPVLGLLVALACSATALFVAGVLKSFITLGSMLKSGAEMLAIGLGSAAATWVLGTLIGQYGL